MKQCCKLGKRIILANMKGLNFFLNFFFPILITVAYSSPIFQPGNCNNIDDLINGDDAHKTKLISSFYKSYLNNEVVWGITQWAIFQSADLEKIISTIGDTRLAPISKHRQIMNFIDVYLQGYSSKLWFYCIRIEDWGYVAQYLKCIDPKFEGVCPNPWSGGMVEPHDLLATTISNIFFEGDCNTRDELIQGPSNETSLIHAFWEGHSEWEENTWNFFKLFYLDPISGVISNDAYSAQEKHAHIFLLIKDFLRAELEDNSWFTCLHIENWGTIADYLNCETGDKEYTCQLQTSLHQ